MKGWALFSPCERYRYRLTREWDPEPGLFEVQRGEAGGFVAFLMLNPSTADATILDPTVRKCVTYAKAWGFAGLQVVNLFALRSTDPQALYEDGLDIVGPENDAHIRTVADISDLVVLAYGQHGKLRGRDAAVLQMLEPWRDKLTCLRRANDGRPYHPLYLPNALKPMPWGAA